MRREKLQTDRKGIEGKNRKKEGYKQEANEWKEEIEKDREKKTEQNKN